jgi:predicted RNA-binding Zn ribbon-like protein
VTVDELRFDAGSVSLNLVATVGRRFGAPVERLHSEARLVEWLAGVGLAGSRADLDGLRALREHLDALFRAALAGDPPPAAASLRVCAADDCRMLYLARDGRERRWCSSERCGNRSRVAAHRARAR